jgi:hypothetical protein
MFHAIASGFNHLFGWLPTFGKWLLDGIYALLKPLFDLVGAIFYFLYKLGVVLVKIVEVVLALGRMLVGLTTGLFKTITGLSFTGRPATLPDSYNQVFTHLQPVLNSLQMDKVAYILTFSIWVFTAFTAIKIIGDMRGGVGSD